MIEINRNVSIGEEELEFRVSRSGGPGGQHVNKTNTRVAVYFDVRASENLSGGQKRRILTKLRTRADKKGVVRVVSQKHRSQKANRDAAVDKLVSLLAEALKRPKPRKKTKKPYRAVRKRLDEKKKRSKLKKQRAKNRGAGSLEEW